MKKFNQLGRSLSKFEQKKINGGSISDSCNVICTKDSQCSTTCTKCVKNANWDDGVCERPVVEEMEQ